jgi:predicted extracellular nuclease
LTLSSGGRLPQPTQVAAPGAAALAVQAANDRNRILLDDAALDRNPGVIVFGRGGAPLTAQNTLRGGDTVRGVVGVLTHTAATTANSGSQYRVRPVGALGGGAPAFTPANPRSARAPAVGGTVRIAAFNVLNYFNTFGGCTFGAGGAPAACRGAANPQEFERQWRKTVAAVLGLDADVIGLAELENDGYGPGSAIAHLVERLNAATAPGTYAFIDADAAAGSVNALGTDAIRVALLYRPARVRPVGRTAVLNATRFVNGGDSAPRNRPSLAQAFTGRAGGRVVVSVNHFKSKGSACDVPDAGDGQGDCSAVRTVAAQELHRWLGTDPTGTGERAVLIIGDLNAYAREDPIATLTRGGYTDLLLAHAGATAYTFVFNGQWGALDHALASAALLPRVTGAAVWHINADEPPALDYRTASRSAAQQTLLFAPGPFRSSDHDPVIVGVRL